MAKFFGDIAKATKDVFSGGVNFDNKYAVDCKKSNGLGVNGSITPKGENTLGTFTTSYVPVKDLSVEASFNQDFKISTTLAHSGLYPGLKATISGRPAEPDTLKLATQLYKYNTGIKVDVANCSAPKIDTSCCYTISGASVGATCTFDTTKSAIQKYSAACQYNDGPSTYALVLADQGKTVKASVAHAFDKTFSIASEAVYKMPKTEFAASIGITKKFAAPICLKTFKVVLASPITSDPKPTATVQATTEVTDSTTVAASLQIDKKLKYKYGIQVTSKM